MLLWNDGNGTADVWVSVNDGDLSSHYTYGPYAGWTPAALAAGSNTVPRILWTNTDGRMSLWSVDGSGGFTHADYGPYTGYTAVGLAVGGDNAPRVMWAKTDGTMSLWRVAPDTTFTHVEYGPFPGYTASLIAAGADSIPRILWTKSDGSISLWHDVTATADFTHQEYGPYSGYTPLSMAVDGNNTPRILWNHPSDGTTSLWSVAPSGSFTFQNVTLPASYVPVAVGTGLDAGSGGYAQVLYVQVGSLGNDGCIDSFAPDGSSRLATYAGPYAGDGTVLSAAGAGTGGGGGGGTTATPNPHGQYVFSGYSGGTLTSSDTAASSVTPPGPLSSNNNIDAYPDAANVWGGTASFTGYGNTTTSVYAKLGGTIYASFKWQADAGYANSPTPTQVTVIQRCTASWTMGANSSGFSGQCNSGLSPGHGPTSGMYEDAVSGIGPAVVSNPGQGFTISACMPTASVSGITGNTNYQCSNGTVSFAYTAAAVTMSVAGTTPDANGIDNILVGQGATGSWNIPASLQNNTTYAWNVSGNTFQSWNGESGTVPVAAVLGFGRADQPTAHWYWTDTMGVKAISCTAIVTPPGGQGSQFTIPVTRQVNLQVPKASATNLTGFGYVGPFQATFPTWVFADASPQMLQQGYTDGSTWATSVSLPAMPTYNGAGKWSYAQIIIPGEFLTADDGTKYPGSKTSGLDGGFPREASTHPTDGRSYNNGDSPALPVDDTFMSAQVTDSFMTYLMFQPPGSDVQWVPLKESEWSTDFHALRPSTRHWASFPATQTVGPVNRKYDFQDQTTHPKW